MKEFEQQFPFECKTYYDHTEVVPWLETNIGQFDREWYRYGTDIAQGIVAGVPLYDYYRFRDEQAAMLFILRWT
jgi:hypothetical protein